MPIAERLTTHLERLPEQRLRLVELALGLQHHPHIIDGDECIRMSIAERRTAPIERLAELRLRLVELALGLQQSRQIVDRV